MKYSNRYLPEVKYKMDTKTILIKIYLDDKIIEADISLRHLLVESIESRALGNVIEETSSLTMLEVVIETAINREIGGDLRSLLLSLGFNNYSIQNISFNDG